MLLMLFMYTVIIRRLWAPNQAASVDSVARKRRVVVMCLAVLVCFFICWLPWHLSDIISDSLELSRLSELEEEEEEGEDEGQSGADIAIFTPALPLVNSFTSPIFYAVLNAGFREKMLAIVLCRPCRPQKVAPAHTVRSTKASTESGAEQN
jgi:hypothetical protein